MTDEEVAVKLAEHNKEIGSLKHRMDDQEEQSKVIQELVMSVKELAINMKNMIDEQKRQGVRLSVLEGQDSDTYKKIKLTIITALTSGIVGAVIGTLINFF